MVSKKTNIEYFAKHPLASKIMQTVEKWSNENYPTVNGKNITPTTRELLNYWFDENIHEDIKFHKCQKRAIETVIYCYEILDLPLPKDLFSIFNEVELKGGVLVELEKMGYPRFAIKMATGTGKTWVIQALIIWQYFNKLKHQDKRFSTHFLLFAPGNIVYDRLLDSFEGKMKDGKRNKNTSDISLDLFMPKDWRVEFNLRIYTKEDITGNTQTTNVPFVMITNWHQLIDTKNESISTAKYLGLDFQDESESYRVQNFYDFLSANPDLVIINDEAHHLYNASDKDLKRWQESIEKIFLKIKEYDNPSFCQFDFTATPYVISGKKKEWMKHVIYDYGLVEAMNEDRKSVV